MADVTLIGPVPFEDAIRIARDRGVVLPDAYYGILQGAARAAAFSVAGLSALAQLQAVLDSLAEALASGESMDSWVMRVKSGQIPLDLPDWRLMNIFRTNIQGAYGAGRWRRHDAGRDRRPYLLYDAVNDSRTRPAHAAMDGIIRPIDDLFWSTHYPPNGYQCRCRVVALTEAQAQARGGVTQTIPPEAQPDPGWGYNPGRATDAGIAQAVQRAVAQAHPALADALTTLLMGGP